MTKAYSAFEDITVNHSQNHVEPNNMKDLQSSQQAIVIIINVCTRSDDHVTFKQSTV